MKLSLYTGGFVQTNGYLLQSPEGNLLIDAPQGIASWLDDQGVRIDHLLLTHQHYDHVQDAAAIQASGAKVHAFAPYSRDLTLESVARKWGMPIAVDPYEIDQLFDLTQPIQLAGKTITLAHVPGHSTDSVTFYFPAIAQLFPGDTLFAGSIGRCDLPGGSEATLLAGIARHLLILPAETKVFPGHGSATTIGTEARQNPYL